MNKISLYIFLILIFLGLSKSFSPSVIKTYHMKDVNVFADDLKEENFSIFLLDTLRTGFMIKTYFLKLKIIHGFKPAEYYTVRTTKKLFYHYKTYLGMSLYRIGEKSQSQNSTPMPPGTLFVGNPAYGHWKNHDSGQRFWQFHRAYQRFPQMFYWGDFRPSYQFFKNTQAAIKNQIPYLGNNHEFGINGIVTKENLKIQNEESSYIKIKLKRYIKKYITLPPWTKG